MSLLLRSQDRDSQGSEDERLYLSEHPVHDDEDDEETDYRYFSDKPTRNRCCKLGIIFLAIVILTLGSYAVVHFTQSSSSESSEPSIFQCKHSVVGAGYGGLYYLWRLSLSSSPIFQAKDFCVFESSYRIGGRAYAYGIDNQNVIVDLGASRYSRSQELISGLIKTVLGFPVICDNGGEIPCVNNSGYEVIRDDYGNNGGFSKAITKILNLFTSNGGTPIYLNHELINVQESTEDNDFKFLLTFKNGVKALTQTVLLNLPSENIAKLDKTNIIMQKADNLTLSAISNTMETPIAKLYVEYQDAWWLSKLNKTNGSATWTDGQLPSAYVRYADGPVKCKVGSNGAWSSVPVAGGNCWGYLQMSYALDVASVNYLASFATSQDTAKDVSISIPLGDPTRSSLVTTSHNRLMNYHRSLFEAVGINPDSLPLPTSVVISIWNSRYGKYPSEHVLVDNNGQTISDPYWEIRNRVPIPIPNYDLFLANEAWCNCGWGEGSLIMVERLLQTKYALTKPDWISDSYWKNNVIPWLSPNQECWQDNECPQTGNPCINVSCKVGTCTYEYLTNSPCNSGDLCIVDARCTSDGICQGAPLQCSNTTICVDGTCQALLPPSLPKCQSTIDTLLLYWEFLSNDIIQIAFSLPGSAMVGLGFGTGMAGSDLIIGWVASDGAYYVDDYFATVPGTPDLDVALGGTSDVQDTYGIRDGNRTTLWFQRKLDTGDSYDTVIREGNTSIVFAWADGDKVGLTYHGENKRISQVNLIPC